MAMRRIVSEACMTREAPEGGSSQCRSWVLVFEKKDRTVSLPSNSQTELKVDGVRHYLYKSTNDDHVSFPTCQCFLPCVSIRNGRTRHMSRSSRDVTVLVCDSATLFIRIERIFDSHGQISIAQQQINNNRSTTGDPQQQISNNNNKSLDCKEWGSEEQ